MSIRTRIENIIREHYDETAGMLLSSHVTTVVRDKVHIAQTIVVWEGDDEYRVTTETVRVDDNGLTGLTFTILDTSTIDLTEVAR